MSNPFKQFNPNVPLARRVADLNHWRWTAGRSVGSPFQTFYSGGAGDLETYQECLQGVLKAVGLIPVEEGG